MARDTALRLAPPRFRHLPISRRRPSAGRRMASPWPRARA